MSRYVVRIIGPSGMETYLCRGRETHIQAATRYPHPSSAYRAADAYFCKQHSAEVRAGKRPGSFIFDVLDMRDPERRVR